MKTALITLIFSIVIQALCSPLTAAATSPNLILILADDLGYGDVGAYGATLIEMNIDFLPTFAAIAGLSLAPALQLDGRNILPLLTGGPEQSPHEALYFFNNERIAALRTQDWKIVVQANYRGIDRHLPEHGVLLLFDMQKDPMERYSLAAHRPDKWQELHTYLERGQRELESLAQHLNTDSSTDMR